MLVLFIVVLCQLEPSLGAGETGNKALKFGQDANSYISFSPDMRPFQNELSVCSWVKKLRSVSGSSLTWFRYGNSEIRISDGGFNIIFGNNLDLTSKFTSTLTQGLWYHQCDTWSIQSRTLRVYLNGLLVGTRTTPSGRTLTLGGVLLIGNYSPGNSWYFGGELYHLNVYSKELSASEVGDMAALGGPCPGGEELHDDTRQLKWETILQQTRNGNVREIEIIETLTCKLVKALSQLNETERRLDSTALELNSTAHELEDIQQQLNSTAHELDDTQQQLNSTAHDLEGTQQQLNSTAHELEDTQQQLNSTAHELEGTQQQLNSTAHELDEATKQLENMTECLQERDSIAQWDLFYSETFFNNVFTKDLYMKLSSSWDIFEDFVARVKIARRLISHFNDNHKKETCGPDDEK